MTKIEFKLALTLAKSGNYALDADISALCGFGLPDFKPVSVSLDCAARCVAWQAACMDGTWDEANISECEYFFTRRVSLNEFSSVSEIDKVIQALSDVRLKISGSMIPVSPVRLICKNTGFQG